MITTCTRKHHGGSGEVNKERIAVNTFLYAFPYRSRCIILPSFLSMLQALWIKLVQQRVLLARLLPGWLSGKQTPEFFRLTQRQRTTSNLVWDNAGRRYKWTRYRSFSPWACLCLNPAIQGYNLFFFSWPLPPCSPELKAETINPLTTYLKNSCKSRVCYFVNIVFTNKNIPGCQIPMDIVLRFKVCHPRSHLSSHVYLMCQGDLRASIFCLKRRWQEQHKNKNNVQISGINNWKPDWFKQPTWTNQTMQYNKVTAQTNDRD